MTSERWNQVEEKFHAALEQPEDGRDAWLRMACGTDAGLLEEVRSLLAADGGREFAFEREIRRTAAMLLLTFGLPRLV